jgi:hypothetical protein
MRFTPFIVTAATLFALTACNRGAAPNASAGAGGNSAAPAAPAAPTAPTPAGGNTAGAEAAPGNGLWGVVEEEDAASHRGIDFIAFNRSGRTLTGLAIRPDEGPLAAGAEETPWSDNILAQRELPDGTRAAAHYEADIEICRWQLRATFADRRTRDYPAVNLCETIRVDLR